MHLSRRKPAITSACSSYARPLAGLATVVVIARRLRRRGGSVPGRLHQERAGHRRVAARRLGDEPGRQSEDARRGGGQGRLDRSAAERRSRPAPCDATRRRCISFRPMCSSTSRRRRCSAPSSSSWCRPPIPRAARCTPDQVLEGKHVTVEINTVFQQLTSLLSTIDPAKLNETLGANSVGGERPRPQDRPDAVRSGCVSGQAGARACPR